MRKAAVCNAVAAAARRAAWDRAFASFCAQSGLIRSVVTTSGASLPNVIRRRPPGDAGGELDNPPERDVVDEEFDRFALVPCATADACEI